jgi:hypothetical protein
VDGAAEKYIRANGDYIEQAHEKLFGPKVLFGPSGDAHAQVKDPRYQ